MSRSGFPIKFPLKPWIDFPAGTLSDSGQKVEKVESKIFKYSLINSLQCLSNKHGQNQEEGGTWSQLWQRSCKRGARPLGPLTQVPEIKTLSTLVSRHLHDPNAAALLADFLVSAAAIAIDRPPVVRSGRSWAHFERKTGAHHFGVQAWARFRAPSVFFCTGLTFYTLSCPE